MTGSLPWSRANFSLFYDGPTDTWMQGLDVDAIVHYTGQYEDDNLSLPKCMVWGILQATNAEKWASSLARAESARVDYAGSDCVLHVQSATACTAQVPGFAKDGGKSVNVKDGKQKNVIPVSTAEYNPCGWRAWLNNTTISLGMQNVFDEDPPFVAGASRTATTNRLPPSKAGSGKSS